jgi:hypothetical protein
MDQFELTKLSRTDVSKLFNVTYKTIENWYKRTDDPLPYHLDGQSKYFVMTECLEWYVRMNTPKQTVVQFKPKSELDEAKLEGQNLRNEAEQIELDVRKGKLLEVEDVRRTWSDALVTIRQSLINVGHVAATEITNGMRHNTKKKIIDGRIFASLNTVIEDVEKAV